MTVLFVGIGGLCGVLSRYGLSVWVQSIWTIAAINLAGSFLLGLLTTAGGPLSSDVRTGIGIGFIGGFTTLSTLTTQTVISADGDRVALAAIYLTISVVGGILAATAGYALGRVVA